MVFPHTCDSIQRLSDIWRLNTHHGFFADVVMPAKLNTPSARAYMRDVLEKFKTDLEGLIPEDLPPLEALTARYADRAVCPAKHSGTTVRGENLVTLCKTHNADGVIFTLLKFCDPHGFDYPYLKEFLDEAGIKSLLLEMDDQQQGQGQLSTRLETFVHMI